MNTPFTAVPEWTGKGDACRAPLSLTGFRLRAGYGNELVLHGLDICVRKGEITTFIGPNGSGKSTVLRALTRLLRLRSGVVCCGGVSLDQIPSRTLAQHIAILPQQHPVPPEFKVADLVAFGRVPHQGWRSGLSAGDRAAVERAMAATGVTALRDKPLSACSGGEAQRVWIATVLAQEPDLLFLDEPTTFLDISYQFEILQLVKDLNRRLGTGVVLVLHDLGQALEISDRVVIRNGRKYCEGPPEAVITPQLMRRVYQVDCDVLYVPGRRKPVLVYKEIQ